MSTLTRNGRKVVTKYTIDKTLETKGLMPTVCQYGGYDGNYGSHAMSFSFLGCTFWFSYQTLIAFKIRDNKQVLLKNYWGPTTGRHLSYIGSWDERVPENEFIVTLNNQLKEAGLGDGQVPFFRVVQDPKTLEYSGYYGYKKADEPAVPPPKPKKSDFYLHPRKPTRKDKRWMKEHAEKERLQKELANIDGIFEWAGTVDFV